MTGMEMMLKQVFKSLGINGDEVMNIANGVQAYIEHSAKTQAETLARVQRIESMVRDLCAEKGVQTPALIGEVQDGNE